MTVNALVLNHSPWRDYDRMVTLLTPDQGRLDVVARGCRKPKSPLMNATERFCAGEFSVIEAHGRFTMTDCAISENFYPLREDYDRLTAGAYILHLLIQSAPAGQSAHALFHTALRALAFLSYSDLPIPLVIMAFELHYLSLIGQAPHVDTCVVCGHPFVDESSTLDLRRGGAVCKNCPAIGKALAHGARRILLRVPQTQFDAVSKLPDHPNLPEAQFHTRDFIKYQMDHPPKLWPALGDEEAGEARHGLCP